MIPNRIESALYGFITSQLLFTADRLGIFLVLHEKKRQTAAEIAESLNLPTENTRRFLNAAVACKLLILTDPDYHLPEDMASFVSGYPTPREHFSHFDTMSTLTLRHLEHAVRGEGPQWQRAFPGTADANPFELIYQDDDRAAAFLDTMWALGYDLSKELMGSFSLDGYTDLVDLGGGSGAFAVAALEQFPHLSAAVYDLKGVQPHLMRRVQSRGLQGRLGFLPGDFFKEDTYPQADVYSIGYILSDWSTEQGGMILDRIYRALRPGGCLIILEKLFSEDQCSPLSTCMLDIAMMVETWGRHRTSSEYEAWLEKHGFERSHTVRSSGEKHMIIGYKPQ